MRIQFAYCRVEAPSLEAFLDAYYKHDRYKGRDGEVWGKDYSAHILASAREHLSNYGFVVIGHYESRTGDTVAWPPIND